jgi:hypothetical protein
MTDTHLISKRQAARFLGISQASLERLLRTGLPYIKITPGPSGAVRLRPEDLIDFVERRRVNPAA